MSNSFSSFKRLSLVYLIAAALVLLSIVAGSMWLASRTSTLIAQVQDERQFRNAALAISESLLNAETGQRGFLLTSNRRYLAPFESAKRDIASQLAVLRSLPTSSQLREKISNIAELTTQKLIELSETVALAESGRDEEARDIVRTDKGQLLMEQARGTLAEITVATENAIAESVSNLAMEISILRWINVLGGSLIAVFALGTIFAVVQYVREIVRARTEVVELNSGLEQRVADRTSALTRANEEIQRFAYIVSHDLRAPLVNIMGFTTELEVGVASLRSYVTQNEPDVNVTSRAQQAAGEDLPEAVRFIRASTAKMDGLINAILKLSREGRRELRPEPVDFKVLFSNAIAAMRHQIDNTRSTVELANFVSTVISDRLALEQIAGNLLDNALKYLEPGRPGLIRIRAEKHQARVIFSISDNGRGVAANDLERIFELFRRAGAQDRPGEGIGLAHVRALVRRLGEIGRAHV